MTRKQFDNKIMSFINLVELDVGIKLGFKYVEEEVIKFYAKERILPQMYVNKKTGSFGMK